MNNLVVISSKDISAQRVGFFMGESNAYAVAVGLGNKPLAEFNIHFPENAENRFVIQELAKIARRDAKRFGAKCYVHEGRFEFMDKDGVYSEPEVEFVFYKDQEILNRYLELYHNRDRTEKDHRILGDVFGCTGENINQFIQSQKQSLGCRVSWPKIFEAIGCYTPSRGASRIH